ncbi:MULTISPECIES: ribulokinase [Olivibacter]|jgi:L-ribulokinase|uniref:Ribulokinase n=1 Tax=Olivibacter oleidegradans TaxID=760123 RepID=A0ABV6HE22_9SPHI|nr:MULTISPECIES: ribulokinase [Olivibacter]QEK99639.1 ribulokinase [Olivibacter sp. LS-1]
MDNAYVIGVDYGTDSVRSVLVNARNGQEIASSIYHYPRWKKGLYCNPSINQFRQHPLDYIEGLEYTIKDCLKQSGEQISANVKAIAVDTTGSTPVAVDKTGTPLALLPAFEENPNAMFVLWKDHTSVKEADEINQTAKKFDINYLQYVGGIYSSEWFWAKLLHILRKDKAIANNIFTWVEHCDWIPFLLTGGKDALHIKRGVCSAGHKSLWNESFDGYPPNEFFIAVDPLLNGFTDNISADTYTADKKAGNLCEEWAQKLGLSTSVVIGIGAFDAHMGAVGGQIEPYYLSKVMGTSTCDMLVAPNHEVDGILVSGICGQVNGSVIPGMLGMEAGQSAFGDAYAWFKNLLMWPLKNLLSTNDNPALDDLANQLEQQIIPQLSKLAEKIEPNIQQEFAIDWLNGRRTPDANQALKGAFFDLNLGTDAVQLFRALAEATCFGAKKIVDRFNEQGVPVKGLIGMGGVARKAPFIMQMMADVMDMPIKIHRSEQTCAIGAAMFAATAAGIYTKVEEAMSAMGQGFDAEYHPNPQRVAIYKLRYEKYTQMGMLIEEKLTSKDNILTHIA